MEEIHHKIKEVYAQNGPDKGRQLIESNLIVLDNFFKYLLLQTFPEVLCLQNVDDYQMILDQESFE